MSLGNTRNSPQRTFTGTHVSEKFDERKHF